jgi:deoxyribonuclease V
VDWPRTRAELVVAQASLRDRAPDRWTPPERHLAIGACFVCFRKGRKGRGRAGEPGWAGAVVWRVGQKTQTAVVSGVAGAPYDAGLLALREGPLLGSALEHLSTMPPVVLVNATGRDHPRRAGLALHLGSMFDVPTIGVTHRPLLAHGEWPGEGRGEATPLELGEEVVGYWLRTRTDRRPIAVHAAWRTDPETALSITQTMVLRARTPEPLRHARRIARLARAGLLNPPESGDRTD